MLQAILFRRACKETKLFQESSLSLFGTESPSQTRVATSCVAFDSQWSRNFGKCLQLSDENLAKRCGQGLKWFQVVSRRRKVIGTTSFRNWKPIVWEDRSRLIYVCRKRVKRTSKHPRGDFKRDLSPSIGCPFIFLRRSRWSGVIDAYFHPIS